MAFLFVHAKLRKLVGRPKEYFCPFLKLVHTTFTQFIFQLADFFIDCYQKPLRKPTWLKIIVLAHACLSTMTDRMLNALGHLLFL